MVFKFTDKSGNPLRITGGELAKRVNMRNKLNISLFQNKKELPLKLNYDKKIWSGLSWAVAEIEAGSYDQNKPVKVELNADPVQVKQAEMQAFASYIKH